MPETPTESREPPSSAGTPVAGLTTTRRAPRYRAFALTGVVLGLLAGVLLAGLAGAAATASPIVLAGVVGGLLGALLGALVAVLLDRPPRRP